jgi:hypothetical protein
LIQRLVYIQIKRNKRSRKLTHNQGNENLNMYLPFFTFLLFASTAVTAGGAPSKDTTKDPFLGWIYIDR